MSSLGGSSSLHRQAWLVSEGRPSPLSSFRRPGWIRHRPDIRVQLLQAVLPSIDGRWVPQATAPQPCSSRLAEAAPRPTAFLCLDTGAASLENRPIGPALSPHPDKNVWPLPPETQVRTEAHRLVRFCPGAQGFIERGWSLSALLFATHSPPTVYEAGPPDWYPRSSVFTCNFSTVLRRILSQKTVYISLTLS